MKIIKIGCLLLACCYFAACRKGPGEGGNSTITGKVYGNYYTKTYTAKIKSDYVGLEDVYIIFGDDITYGTNQKTNYDGTYAFRYLRPGHYRIYCYSRDSTGAAAINKGGSTLVFNPAMKAIIADVEISASNQTVKVPDLVIIPK